jgi:glucokinase
MTQQFAVGVDIGGTKMAFALVNQDGQILADHRLPTQPTTGVDQVIDTIIQGVNVVQDGHPIAGVGIGIPGYVDPVNGVVIEAVNLGWQNVALAERLSADFKLPVKVQKDVNAAVWGEAKFGAAQGIRDGVLIAIGTGLGIGVMVKGRLVTGADGAAGELAHVALNLSGRLCRCGLRGCPETYISGIGLLAGVHEYASKYPNSPLTQPNISTQQIIDAWHNNDPLAGQIFADAFERLTQITLMCVGLLNPQMIILGGGLGLALAETFLNHLSPQVIQRTHPAAHRNLRLVKSMVTSSAVGAAALILSPLE